MRPADDGEHMICLDCAKKGASMRTETTLSEKAKETEPFSGPRKKKETTKSEKMFKYICTNCKYKFSRKESQPAEKCPYCGKQTIVHDDQLGAEKLIRLVVFFYYFCLFNQSRVIFIASALALLLFSNS